MLTKINKCSTPYCRNTAVPGRTICHKCRSRKYKKQHPDVYFFNALRNNARRRNKLFTLTLDQFRDFCNRTGYLDKKGKNGYDMSIDRKISSKGYTADNIQVLSLSDNTKKEHSDTPF